MRVERKTGKIREPGTTEKPEVLDNLLRLQRGLNTAEVLGRSPRGENARREALKAGVEVVTSRDYDTLEDELDVISKKDPAEARRIRSALMESRLEFVREFRERQERERGL